MAVPIAGPPVALYVHVPFCISVCPYCDFVVYAGSAARGPRARVEAFVGAVRAELGLRAEVLDEAFGRSRPALETVYFGGGTPSLLGPNVIADLLELIRVRFGVAPDAEVTIEANPGHDERGDPRALRDAGATRVSIGAQSMSDEELRRIGRRHDAEAVRDAVEVFRRGGFESVSLDLLYDIPGSSLGSWVDTLGRALVLEPDHLSLYALTLDDSGAEGLTGHAGDHLPTTAGARRWRERARPGQDEDRAVDQYRYAVDRLAADGWRGYEISNWARPGHESRHNMVYWQCRRFEAVGPGAHAFDGVIRRWNAARLEAYVTSLSPTDGTAPRLPPGGSATLDPSSAKTESIILGLRTDRGVPITTAEEPSFSEAFRWAFDAEIAEAVEDQRIVLTTRGRLLSNELFSRLI